MKKILSVLLIFTLIFGSFCYADSERDGFILNPENKTFSTGESKVFISGKGKVGERVKIRHINNAESKEKVIEISRTGYFLTEINLMEGKNELQFVKIDENNNCIKDERVIYYLTEEKIKKIKEIEVVEIDKILKTPKSVKELKNKAIVFNGRKIPFNINELITKDDELYVPVRFLEKLNTEVKYNPKEKTIDIRKNYMDEYNGGGMYYIYYKRLCKGDAERFKDFAVTNLTSSSIILDENDYTFYLGEIKPFQRRLYNRYNGGWCDISIFNEEGKNYIPLSFVVQNWGITFE